MSHLIRRSLFVKTFVVALVVAPSLFAQVAQYHDECDQDCHVRATGYYNHLSRTSSMSESRKLELAGEYKENCLELSC